MELPQNNFKPPLRFSVDASLRLAYGLCVTTREADMQVKRFDYGVGIFGRAVQCYEISGEFYVYGVTFLGEVKVVASLSMARELAAGAVLSC
jgi:hypothetical protein